MCQFDPGLKNYDREMEARLGELGRQQRLVGKVPELAAPFTGDVYAPFAERQRVCNERDSALKSALMWRLIALVFFIAMLWVCARPANVAAPCPASGVMQLDPTTVRARASEAVEI
jgi:hypothetical protein